MTMLMQQIINKYQGVVPQKVVHAVKQAAIRTGADFSFLMEKAAAESSFNPAAKSKTSSATGLFQFIESTWLNMVKEHGAKYGLGKYADQIEIKNGKPCVDDCKTRDAILNLRKNPEIAALMAGEFSAGNEEYLKAHTNDRVGATELYLAHFLGAGGATKFLNSREDNGNAVAARLFPREARANKNVFFNSAGQARTLDQIYNVFAKKFTTGTTPPSPSAPTPRTHVAEAGSAPAQSAQTLMPLKVAQAISLDDIIWNDELPADRSGFSHNVSLFPHRISAENILFMAQMREPQPAFTRESRVAESREKPRYNS